MLESGMCGLSLNKVERMMEAEISFLLRPCERQKNGCFLVQKEKVHYENEQIAQSIQFTQYLQKYYTTSEIGTTHIVLSFCHIVPINSAIYLRLRRNQRAPKFKENPHINFLISLSFLHAYHT